MVRLIKPLVSKDRSQIIIGNHQNGDPHRPQFSHFSRYQQSRREKKTLPAEGCGWMPADGRTIEHGINKRRPGRAGAFGSCEIVAMKMISCSSSKLLEYSINDFM